MEKGFYSYNEMLKNTVTRQGSTCCDENADMSVCINTDHCMPTPYDMNSGILTMAFVDMQPLESVYPPETALKNGTLFPNIDKPFRGGMVR